MLVFKCKMCGGDLSVDKNLKIGICQYCGSKMTLPRESGQEIIDLFNRANYYRINYEFEKAAGLLESILDKNASEAEAYWGLVLCKFGVVYVEDPHNGKRIPTCHRTQFLPIFADPDYKTAIKYSDDAAVELIKVEAEAINQIQTQILEISSKEEPFDIFICYKETDEDGKRLIDSVLAQELYFQLINKGYKVFFSRITLEEKLGSAYEPYIFSALKSSKVMIVVGTKPEYINSPWVKNEWSRYLTMIKNGEKKTLIPAYRDMDPYDLPEEFSYLQAQDMAKLGFMQDLVRGIEKLVNNSNENVARENLQTNSSPDNKNYQTLGSSQTENKFFSEFKENVNDEDLPINSSSYNKPYQTSGKAEVENKKTARTIIAIGIGAAIFMLLFMYIRIPSPVQGTSFQVAYGFSAFMATLFGPIAGASIAFIGHALSDALQYGSLWWSWVIASGVAGFVFGFAFKRTKVKEGEFTVKDFLTFNLFQIIGNVIAWVVVAPVLDILIYQEPVSLVFSQGITAAIMNIISAGVIGTLLLLAYASIRAKKGSLKKAK